MAQHAVKGARFHVITGNRLTDGEVVYFDAHNQWNTDLAKAEIMDGSETLEARMTAALAPHFQQTVIDIYAFAVEEPAGDHIQPISVREIIRAAGPTVRRDLGKQAPPVPTRNV